MSKRIRFASFVIFLALIAGGLTYGWHWATQPQTFPVKSVLVVGQLHFVSEEKVSSIVMPYVSKGFFNVPVALIQHRLLQIPGVKKVDIGRRFPAQVTIHVIERTPVASYAKGGLISDNGILFKPHQVKEVSALPTVDAPQSELLPAVKMYQSLSAVLAADKLAIAKLDLDKSGQWVIHLASGPIIYPGEEQVIPRVKNFVKAYNDLIEKNKGKILQSVDLRYRQGFAVRWEKS